MQYIKKLVAENIGAFDSLEIEFSQKNNIIIGPNSSGKTSVLKFISFCFSNFQYEDFRFRTNTSFYVDFNINGEEFTSGAKKLVSFDQMYRQNSVTNWGRASTTNNYLPFEDNPFNLFVIGAYRYFEYEQISGMKREGKGDERKKFYKNNNSISLKKPSLPPIKQWMINRYFVVEKDWANIEKNNWERLIEYLPNLVSKEQDFKFLRIERDLEPIFQINYKECYLEELSGGFKSILSIIFSIIDWCEGVNESDLGNISQTIGTVMIDEIDAHLHPEWQLKILTHLNQLFPKLQFIVTTHSPHIISNASANELIRIPNHNGTVKAKPLDKNFNYWEITDILSDLMGYDNLTDHNISDILKKLDNCIEQKNIKMYEIYLNELKRLLHSNDPIIKVYEINKSKIYLND
jgi:predicted ATP-binding protein involved in virulence